MAKGGERTGGGRHKKDCMCPKHGSAEVVEAKQRADLSVLQKFLDEPDPDNPEKVGRGALLMEEVYRNGVYGGHYKSLELLTHYRFGKPIVITENTEITELTGDDLASLAAALKGNLAVDGEGKPYLAFKDGEEQTGS